MTHSKNFDGGCACGTLRYSATSDPLDAGYCHCRICQRTTGAQVERATEYSFVVDHDSDGY